MSIDDADSELLKLLAARAFAKSGRMKEAWEELDKLNLSYFPARMALRLERGLNAHRKRGSSPVSGFAATGKAIDEAIEYFTSVHKVALGAAFPEMSEQIAVNAINRHWANSVLFYIIVGLGVVLAGGSIYGEIKIQGIGSELADAQTKADAALTRANGVKAHADKNAQDVDAALDDIADRLNKQNARLQDAEGKIDTQIRTAADNLGNDLRTSLQKRQGELTDQLNVAGTAANKSVTDAGGAAIKKIQEAADQYVGKPLAKAVSDRVDTVSRKKVGALDDKLTAAAVSLQGIETDKRLAESEAKDIHDAWCALNPAPAKRRGHKACS